ncbi:MAG: hypothetical protein LUC83_10075 [Clostridiales bacterium]|nr:hypothetical protein [Clostridiales bacterium]
MINNIGQFMADLYLDAYQEALDRTHNPERAVNVATAVSFSVLQSPHGPLKKQQEEQKAATDSFGQLMAAIVAGAMSRQQFSEEDPEDDSAEEKPDASQK